jgi:hypothetical protein
MESSTLRQMRAWVQFHFKLDTTNMTVDDIIDHWVEVEYVMNEVNKGK